MITNNYFICLFITLIGVYLVGCDTIQKTPSKNTSSNRSTNVYGRSNRNTTAPNATGRTHASVPRTTANTKTNTTSRTNTNTKTTANSRTTNTTTKAPTTTPRGSGVATPRSSELRTIPAVVEIARNYTGTPYVFGGNDKSGIDCSGLICSVYTEAGYKVPRISWQQSEFGHEVAEISQIKPGDWLFFVPEAGKEGYVSHSGIVTEVRGANEIIFIHASTSKGVREDNLYSNYFKNRFVKAMRPF